MDFEEWEWTKISSEMFAGSQETAIGMRWVILLDRGEPLSLSIPPVMTLS